MIGQSSAEQIARQVEFGKSLRYDATQCIVIAEKLITDKKKKVRLLLSENLCSRPIHGLTCFNIRKPKLKFLKTGWHCDLRRYKARSRNMVSNNGKYGKVKKWAGCNQENEGCIQILGRTKSLVNASGNDPEIIAHNLQ